MILQVVHKLPCIFKYVTATRARTIVLIMYRLHKHPAANYKGNVALKLKNFMDITPNSQMAEFHRIPS